MRTVTKNGKYCVSTVQITKNWYETAVFPIHLVSTGTFSNAYEIEWADEMDRINYSGWINHFKIHSLLVDYWSLK